MGAWEAEERKRKVEREEKRKVARGGSRGGAGERKERKEGGEEGGGGRWPTTVVMDKCSEIVWESVRRNWERYLDVGGGKVVGEGEEGVDGVEVKRREFEELVSSSRSLRRVEFFRFFLF